MQIKIGLTSDSDIVLPIHYNHIVQGFIYNNIDEKLAMFLHNKGFIKNSRTFKLFTFSNILKKGRKIGKSFNFGKNISIIVSSPIDDFCKSIANSMLQNDNLILGSNNLKVGQIELINEELSKEEIIIESLSPIVMYSTLFKADGKKFTYYYQAHEKEFGKLIGENLIKKYNAFYGEGIKFKKEIKIKPIGKVKQSFVYYKNFIVKGESGRFSVKGDRRLLQIGLDAGFGGKNSQGFGCVKIIEGS